MPRNRSTRRSFLQGAARAAATAFAAPLVIPSSALGRDGSVAPSNRITLGMIGTGHHGRGWNLTHLMPHKDAQVVAVCDVDADHLAAGQKMVDQYYAQASGHGSYTACTPFHDFRDLLARQDIDAVQISTPDHWHVIPAIAAAKAGKDVICEKPLSLTIAEGRACADVMKQTGRIFQTSSENRSDKNFHRMCELVRNGRIGKLKKIRVCLPRGHRGENVSQETMPVPKGFDYDFWLGQAPLAPYCPARCHMDFRWIFDYSGGRLTDWGAHLLDLAQWGNDSELSGPVQVQGKGTFLPKGSLYNTATDFDIDYEYANGVELNVSSSTPSIRFEGTEGWIYCPSWRAPLQAEPQTVLDSVIGPDETHLYTCPGGEHRNFLDCVKSRKPCYAPAEIGHRTITIAHIGNISMLLGRKLQWNPDKERFVDDAEADRMLSREMRAPWTLG